MHWNVFSSLILNIKRVLPECCLRRRCCLETTSDRMFKRGFNKFRKEIEVTNLIRTIRILKANAKKNFSKIQWRLFKLQKGSRRLHVFDTNDKVAENKVFKE